MKLILSVFLCALVSAGDIDQKFQKYNIVPLVIPVAPQDLLQVVYPSNAKVSLGDELTPTAVKDEPKVTWVTEQDSKYALIMSDPDAASVKGFLHWLVVNINGSDVHSGKVIAEYIGSGPPKGTGLHRYIFTVFKQPNEVNFTESYSANDSFFGRGGFSEQKFAERYNLGMPVAGNFYQAQYDDYVPILHSRFMKVTTPTPAIVSVRSVPEYIESSTGTQTFDIDIPTHHDIKAAYISDDHEVHSKVIHEADLTTASSLGDSNLAHSTDGPMNVYPLGVKSALTSTSEAPNSTDLIPHDNIIKATVVGNDTFVHTKVDRVEHLSGENHVEKVTGNSSDDEGVTTETPVAHHGVIIGAYKLNDSVLHTKVLNEEEIQHHKTDTFDTTEPTVPHDGLVKAAFVSDDFVVHSQTLNEEQLKSKQTDLKDTEADSSNVEASKLEPTAEVTTKSDSTPAYTTSEITNVDSAQSTDRSATTIGLNDERSKDVLVTVPASEKSLISSHDEKSKDTTISEVAMSVEANSTAVPSPKEESDIGSSTVSDIGSGTVSDIGSSTVSDILSTSNERTDFVTSTPPTFEIKTTISVSTKNSAKDNMDPKENAASYAAQVSEVRY